jgi:hypothetical protein
MERGARIRVDVNALDLANPRPPASATIANRVRTWKIIRSRAISPEGYVQ